MSINKLWAVYFSPTGGTRNTARLVSKSLSADLGIPAQEIDLTRPANRKQTYAFVREDLVVLASPVYAGRVPNKLRPDLEKCLVGNGARVVPVSVFGNRNFDDALIELKTLAEELGFRPVGAAAIVNRHAFCHGLAADRPNAQDKDDILAFSKEVARRVTSSEATPAFVVDGRNPVGPYYTPLKADGTPAVFLKAKPQTHRDRCDQCGACAKLCPMRAIDPNDCALVPGLCIKCHACVHFCHTDAKYFDDPAFLSHVKMLEENCVQPRDNRFFLA